MFYLGCCMQFLDLEAIASDDHSTDDEEEESDHALYHTFYIFKLIL